MKALLLIDIQNDFIPGGALAVTEGDQVVAVANKKMNEFDLVVATQDWHPQNHGSFAANHPPKNIGEIIDLDGLPQILWPVHCVQQSEGAKLVAELKKDKIDTIFVKGTDPKIDSYSGFFDNGHRKATGLGDFLKEKGVTDVYVMGLATDYCVKFSALDAVKLGFKTHLILEGCRGVNLQAGDVDKAIKEMEEAGVTIIPALSESYTTQEKI